MLSVERFAKKMQEIGYQNKEVDVYNTSLSDVLDKYFVKGEKCTYSSEDSGKCLFKQMIKTGCFDCPLNYTYGT